MPINRINGTSQSNNLTGSAGDDLIYGTDPTAAASGTPRLELVADGLGQVVAAAAAPGVADRLYLLSRDGVVRGIEPRSGTAAETPFLDLRGTVQTTLGLAFHPDYAINGKLYVFAVNAVGDSEIREYQVDPNDPERALPQSERLVLLIPQPGGDGHRGGTIVFADDGTLLITTGDGGSGIDPDPYATGQNANDLNGSVLRIDVDADDFPNASRRNYAIPDDNPFADGIGGAVEVWAYGLRNPFRASVDRGTGELFIGDVGQNTWEEVNLGTPGANFGWSSLEGPDPFPPGSPLPPGDDFVDPIYAYKHASGDGQSVTGGIVYRGPETGLQGRYVFGDFVSGRIFAIDDRDGDGIWQRIEIDNGGLAPGTLVGFAEDASGTLFAIGLGFGADANGTLYRLRPGLPAGVIDAADTLDGGGGNDRIFAGAGDDSARGGSGDDLLQGMEGNDTLRGGVGADSVIGGNSNDSLLGDTGNDTLIGGVGQDTLSGGAGRDVLSGGFSADLLLGGKGADIFRYGAFSDSPGNAVTDTIEGFETGRDRVDVSALVDGNFAFLGADAFLAGGGAQLRLVAAADGSTLEASGTGDAVDLVVRVRHAGVLAQGDFIL